MSDERRKHDRVKVELSVEEVDGSTTYFQRAANLSLGGVFLESTLPHPGGTSVTLKFELPDDQGVVEVTGEVVQATSESELGMRVQFVDLEKDPEVKKKIEELIEKFSGS